jgi:uncharacterized membrane protein YkgB
MPSDANPASLQIEVVDRRIAGFMWQYGHLVLRLALGIIFIWFGALKFFPGLSPAAELVERTVYWIDPGLFIPVLAAWEVLIGVCLLFRPLIRLGILLLFAQMVGTFLPLVLLPQATWLRFPYAPTLEGQYILKNLVIIGAALVIGGTVRRAATTQRV